MKQEEKRVILRIVIAAVLVARRDREWWREIERRHRGAQRFREATKPRFGL